MQDAQRYDPLLRPFAADALDAVDASPALAEQLQERAAILEHEAGVRPRALCEAFALIELLRLHPELLAGLAVLEIELDGGTEWLLTDDPAAARLRLADIGAVEVGTRQAAQVLHEQYGGVALLSTLG